MLGLKKTILGISDLKNLFQSINACYSIDYSNYALSSLKRRIEEFMFSFHILNIDDLIHKIEKDKVFFQLFVKAILVDSTEMFRDPEFWDELKNMVLKKYRYAEDMKIWVPECNSGDEVYTLRIILSQLKLHEKSTVFVGTPSEINIERILKAAIDQKKMEINIANFDRYEEGGKLEEFFAMKSNAAVLNPELLENVKVEKHNFFSDDLPGIFDLILFRNKMLYFNPQLKNEALKRLSTALKPGGFIAVGIKESIDYPLWERDFIVVNESEKIYKRILAS